MASKRREQILATALLLFNEQGAGKVTTNHIAKAMKISPGNLYYYFRSKEEIIAAIVEQMVVAWNPMYDVEERPFHLNELRALLRHNFQLIWQYRFFYREVPTLLGRDPELKVRYLAIRDQRLNQQIAFARALAEANDIGLPQDDQDLRNLFTVAWLISDTWLAFQELEADWDEANLNAHIEKGVELIMSLYRPYF
ncbi:MAG: TetR/AcrR family transcriptional regulator [Chloroflexota bacterium]